MTGTLVWFFFTITPPGMPTMYIGAYGSDLICADWCGSAFYEHGKRCLEEPTPWNCRPIGPGFGVAGGAVVTTCVAIPRREARVMGILKRWGWYWFSYDDWQLHYAGWNRTPFPSWDLAECKRHSDECFAIGDIENTEGSVGGP